MKLLQGGILKQSSVLSKEKPQSLNKLFHISRLMHQLKCSWCVIGFVKNRIMFINEKFETFSFFLGILLTTSIYLIITSATAL